MAEVKNVIEGLSLGFVLVIAQLFMFINANSLYPTLTNEFKTIILVNMLMVAFVFAFASTPISIGGQLFRLSFVKEAWKFLVASGLTFLSLYVLKVAIRGETAIAPIDAITGISVGVILLHSLVIAIDENIVFFGFALGELRAREGTRRIAPLIAIILFALFHFTATGGNWLVLLGYIPIGFIFLWVRDNYSPKSLMALHGVHFAYNLFVIGFYGV